VWIIFVNILKIVIRFPQVEVSDSNDSLYYNPFNV
jgi:hypothetical protein